MQAIGNAGISTYLQTLLLTGGRLGELLGLRWDARLLKFSYICRYIGPERKNPATF